MEVAVISLTHTKNIKTETVFSSPVETMESPVQAQLSLESITDMSELRNLKQRTKNGHMDEIKSGIALIDSLMISKDGFERLPGAYDDTIEKCLSYLNSKNPFFSDGQRRKDIVRNTLAKLLKAREVFNTAMISLPFYAKDAKNREDVTPAIMLKDAASLFTHDQRSQIELNRKKATLDELKRPNNKADSPEMNAVKTAYRQLLDFLTNGEDINDPDYVADVGPIFLSYVSDVIQSCNAYLDKGTPHTYEGKVRRSVVEKILNEVTYMQGKLPEMLADRWDSPELSEINTLAGIYCAASKKYTVNKEPAFKASTQKTFAATSPLMTDKVKEESEKKPKEEAKPAPQVIEVVTHQRIVDGQTRNYSFEKIVPANLSEALAYRKKILTQIEESNLDGKAKELFDYYSQYVSEFRRKEDYKIDPSYLRKIKTTDLDLAGRRRNRILNDGLVPSDLTEEEREIYDYYDQIVKELMVIDQEASKVVPHDQLPVPQYDLKLDETLKGLYERQAMASNDCWSCAGSAILNHFMKKKALSAKDFRATKPVYLEMESLEGIDDSSTYYDAVDDVEAITTDNQSMIRMGSPMGNPFLLADRYFDELRKDPAYKNTVVKNAVFYRGDAIRRSGSQNGMQAGDPNAYHNLKVKFMNTVADALKKGSAIAMLLDLHYYTIVGIRGNTLLVHNSLNRMQPGQIDALNLDKVVFKPNATRGLELTWLEKMTDPEALTREYSELKYDSTSRKFTEGSMRNRDDVAHVQGMVGRKTLLEQDENVRALVSETVYVPKEYQP